jgi:hypothetical protein
MKKLLKPKTIIPAILSAALIGGLFAFANAPRVVLLIFHLAPIFLLYFFATIVVYHAVRCVQWLLLLHHLKVKAGLRARIFSYLFGAVSMYLPGGSYFQNYVLYETKDADPARTSAATTIIIFSEPLVGMLIVLVLGIDHWTWLRWAIGIGMPAVSAGLFGIFWWLRAKGLPDWLERRTLVKRIHGSVDQFIASMAHFRNPLVLGTQAVITAVYLVIGGVGLWLVELMLRLHAPSLTGCIAGYAFAIAAAMFVPLFTDLGSLEVGGVIALVGAGASKHGAVAMMIFDRVLMIVVVFLVLLVAGGMWRDLVRNAFQGRRQSREREARESGARRRPQTASG